MGISMVGPDNIKQRQNLVEITTSILASSNEENIYMLIGQHIHEILSDAIIIVSKFDRINNILAVKNIQGLSSSIKFVVSVLGKSPLDMEFLVDDDKLYEKLMMPELVSLDEFGLHGLTFGQIPEPICQLLVKTFHIDFFYGLGLQWNKEVKAGIAIFSRSEISEETKFYIEDFGKLVSASFEKNQQNEIIKVQEQKFRNIFENVPIGIYRTTPDGKVLMANSAIVDILGFKSKEELINVNRANEGFESTYSRQKFLEQMERDGEINGLEAKWKKRDGSIIYIRENARVIKDKNGKTLYYEGSVEDITQRVNSEKETKKAQKHYEMVFQLSPSAMFTVDSSRNITSWNRRAAELTGYTADEILGKTCATFTLEPCATQCTMFYTHNQFPLIEKECTIRRKDGKVRVIRKNVDLYKEDSRILGAIESFEDITENKIKDAEIKKYHNNLQFLSNSASAFLEDLSENEIFRFTTDKLHELIPHSLVITTQFEKSSMTLTTKAIAGLGEVIGKITSLLGVSPTEKKYVISGDDLIMYKMNTGLKELTDLSILRKDNYFKQGVFDTLKNILKIKRIYFCGLHRHGELMGNVTLVTRNKKDIEHKELIETFIHQASTALHRKQLDQELRVEKNKAEEANRLKSAFLANMSHEIRTPMNGILGFSELLRKKNLSEEKKEKYLDIIHNNGEYLINLINDIIDLSKIHANQIVLEKSEFNLNHLLDELHDFFRYSASIAGKNIQLKHVKPFKTENAVIISDKFRLKQVLVNLLSNALKFTEKGYVEYGYKKEGSDKLQFYVKDTGIGLDGNKQRIVFDRFIQADNSISRKFGGSGLGLSICQGLVEMLGGQIEVTSTPDVGSTFFFTIPIKKKQMNNHASLARKDSSDYNPIKTESMKEILIVEDDDTSFVFLRELLSPPAFVVHRAENGMQAVQICKQNKKLNVILMDINLPKMDGIEATKQIRAFNQQIPIIAQTANAMQEDVDLYAEAGCNAVLTKPINTNKLMEMLQRFHHITT